MDNIFTLEEGAKLDRTINLGELIYALKRAHDLAPVYFDFCECVTYGLDSYRGCSEHLAISWRPPGHSTPLVGEMLKLAEAAVGRDFEGYKGGNYRMTLKTPVWVDNYGRCTNTGIVGYKCDRTTERHTGKPYYSPLILLTAHTEAFI